MLRHTKLKVINYSKFLKHALFSHVCYRSLYFISVKPLSCCTSSHARKSLFSLISKLLSISFLASSFPLSSGHKTRYSGNSPFSSPEAAILLVSTENQDLWPGPTPEVRDSRTSRYFAHALNQV